MMTSLLALFPLPAVPLLLILAAAAYRWRWQSMRIITVVDGDTLVAVDRKGKRRKLRLESIDAPESGQRNGREARAFLERRIGKRWVSVQLRGRDKYRRHLARVRLDGLDLGEALVRDGLAYPLHGKFKGAALVARLAGRGVHAGFGQRKPWQAFSRATALGRLLGRAQSKRRGKRR